MDRLGSSRLTCYFQTGFEFKKRRAFPVIRGVVIAEENESVLLEASLLSLEASTT
jgi:hypothetical protein